MKKKLLGMLLAGTLMVGAVGSYAWFTDRDTVNGDIKLTMGTLDVKVDFNEREWSVVDPESEILDKEPGRKFVNVRPGDSFKRELLISNNGTLEQNVTIKINEDLLNYQIKPGVTIDDMFNLTFTTGESPYSLGKTEDSFKLDSVETAVENSIGGYTSSRKVTLNLEVDPKTGNELNAEGTEYKNVVNLNNIKDAMGNKIPLIVIDAQQINYVEDQN
ncbi:TasA family protein [Clostridium perfringens]|uniref:TasA family protein n=1 Tax=Clostridium perfringens TaxID=1502 RepID=UPI00103E23AE|nr:TasA family protein [Clostridium perfringens]EGS5728299.1 hypothetical protein [Clostridium perfringens]EGT2191831.1 hypothetical protein [Clostridium perfringens]EHA0993299.1 hypothetical protein [Clostridium perfringens]EHA1184306.1 hypothetical protein [Clostridium perfringens]EHK2336052.1 hypothetical protein [Clostridium perfringens]